MSLLKLGGDSLSNVPLSDLFPRMAVRVAGGEDDEIRVDEIDKRHGTPIIASMVWCDYHVRLQRNHFVPLYHFPLGRLESFFQRASSSASISRSIVSPANKTDAPL